MQNTSFDLVTIKKAFGKQDYQILNEDYKKALFNHPLINGLYTTGKSMVIITNTYNWTFELVTGDALDISGYSTEELMQLEGNFVMNFSIKEHTMSNMDTVKACMEYINSCPDEQRDYIFALFFYTATKKNGQLITIQHQSIPLVFDLNYIPFIFCNIYTDISYLDPKNIPHGMLLNKFTREVFHLNRKTSILEKRNELFSEREKEVLRYLINGNSSRDIANILNISYETIRTHRRNILKKAEVNNLAALISYTLLNGIL